MNTLLRFRLRHLLLLAIILPAPTSSVIGGDNVSAAQLMKQAHDARGVWNDFPGFSAELTVRNDGSVSTGTITVSADFSYELDAFEEPVVSWLHHKLRSVIGHRRARPFSDEGFDFSNQEVEGSGRLVARKDGSGVFRIEDGLITEVHRKSDSRWLEISNLQQLPIGDGQVLPQVSSVVYRDPRTGDITSNRSNTFEWTKVGDFHLPARAFTIEVSEKGGRSVRELIFSKHKLNARSERTPRVVMHKPLKEPLTSFGAAVLNEYLYVFGGHDGDAHGFGSDLLCNHFRRIKFDDPNAEWEDLPMQPPAQSVALITDGTYIYRIAGLSFRNSGTQEETDFDSTKHFSRFNPFTNEWTQLQELPESRSSLDAAVVGRSIFVVGGWNLQGKSSSDANWHDTMLRYDLDKPDSGWQTLDGPGYQTRALSVAAHNDKLWILGGIQNRGITRRVSVYDPATNEWSTGPELKPDSSAAGFATSSFATGGHLYYTGGSGVIYRLANDESDWEVAERLMFPRMFLRMLPVGENRLIALGGTGGMTGRSPVVESIRVDKTVAKEDKIFRWSVPYSGRAKHSQSLLLDGTRLYAFGGNASSAPHDFSKEAFVDEAFVFDVARQTVEELPNLPIPVQSGSSVLNVRNSEHKTIVLTGGMSHLNDEFQAVPTLLEYDPESKAWQQLKQEMPTARAMHSAVTHEDAVWVFGGSTVGDDRQQLTSILHWWRDDSDIAALPDQKLPVTRRSFGGGIIDGKYHIVGGLTADTGIANNVDVFDFETRSWSTAASPAVARVFPSVAVSDDSLYLFGGFGQSEGHFAPATSLEKFDAKSGSWTTVADEIPGVNQSMTMFSLSGRLLFFGINEDGNAAEFVLYDPAPMTQPADVATMSFSGRRGSSADEAKRDAKLLLRKDTDKDGRLSASELGSRLSDFFSSADTNSDNFVTLTEAVAALTLQKDAEAAHESSRGSD